MRIFKILVLILSSMATAIGAQTAILHGEVRDTANVPVEGAVVELYLVPES